MQATFFRRMKVSHMSAQVQSAPLSYKGHLVKLLLLGGPLVGSNLAQVAIGLTDTVMVGRYGIEELAAITLANSFWFTLYLFGSGIAFAMSPLVTQFEAKQDDTQTRRATRMGLWISMAFAIAVLPLMIWSEQLFIFVGQDPDVSANAQLYLRIAGFGMVPALALNVMKNYLAGMEDTRIALYVTIAAAAANVLANYMLIFGNLGAPELGLQGAAIASVCAHGVALVYIIWHALKTYPQHQLFVRFWRSDWEMARRVFRLGAPIAFTTLAEVSLFTITAFMMGFIGTVEVAAHGIAIQLSAATFVIHLGLAGAATVRAGNAWAMDDVERLKRGAIVVTALSFAIASTATICFILFPSILIDLFISPNEPARVDVLRVGITLLILSGVFQLVDAMQAIYLALLRGMQDTRVPMMIGITSYLGLGLAVSYGLGFWLGLGAIGIWTGLIVGLAAAAVLLAWRFWKVAVPEMEARAAAI